MPLFVGDDVGQQFDGWFRAFAAGSLDAVYDGSVGLEVQVVQSVGEMAVAPSFAIPVFKVAAKSHFERQFHLERVEKNPRLV